jgi:hypothetical protein
MPGWETRPAFYFPQNVELVVCQFERAPSLPNKRSDLKSSPLSNVAGVEVTIPPRSKAEVVSSRKRRP